MSTMDPLVLIAIFALILIVLIPVLRILIRRILRSLRASHATPQPFGRSLPRRPRFSTSQQLLSYDPLLQESLTKTPALVVANSQHQRRIPWPAIIEIGLLAIWAVYIGAPYLDPSPFIWPSGSEIGIQINTHYFWIQLQKCGACALWDGTINGGMPALANPFGSTLHPLVAITTSLLGVINGAKFALIICFWLAGIAQWWIARSLKLSWLPRMWSAMLAMVGGHLAARMNTGQFAMIVSTVTCSLVIAAAIDLGVTRRRRSTLLLAIFGACAIVSGHGYVQLSLLSWSPAFLFLILNKTLRPRPIWREYALAIGLSVLLAGVFLVPLLHFLPNYAKDTSPSFEYAQPLEYAPLNLVIDDFDFFKTTILGKAADVESYGMYIGWVPILLAMLTLRFARRKDARLLLCLTGGVIMSFLMGSAVLLPTLSSLSTFFDGFRHPSLMGVLVVPAILALGAYGLDRLLMTSWPSIEKIINNLKIVKRLKLSLLLVLVPLTWSLSSAYTFTRYFIRSSDMQDIYVLYFRILFTIKGSDLKWVAPPFGEGNLVEPALSFGVKLTDVSFPSRWQERSNPPAEIIISRTGGYTGTLLVTKLNDVPIYSYPDRAYAYIDTGKSIAPCHASGGSGDIVVDCQTDAPGQLIVQENSWNGWTVTMDNHPVTLNDNIWLSTDAAAGIHRYEFRYLPWDVPVGLGVTIIGILLLLWLWFRAPNSMPNQLFDIQTRSIDRLNSIDPPPPITSAPSTVSHCHDEVRFRKWEVSLGLMLTLTGFGMFTWLWFRASQKTSRTEIDEQRPAA